MPLPMGQDLAVTNPPGKKYGGQESPVRRGKSR